MPPHPSFPSSARGLELHARLPIDPTTTADICEAYVPPLLAWLQQQSPQADPGLCLTAVHIAMMSYLKHPEQFDPEKGELGAYLRMAAQGDLCNELRKERRHHRLRIAMEPVELDAVAGNSSCGQTEPLERMQTDEEVRDMQQRLDEVRADFSSAENAALDLMLAGEKSTAVFAEVLGVRDQAESDQARAVKRTKDRIKKRLQRGGCYDKPT